MCTSKSINQLYGGIKSFFSWLHILGQTYNGREKWKVKLIRHWFCIVTCIQRFISAHEIWESLFDELFIPTVFHDTQYKGVIFAGNHYPDSRFLSTYKDCRGSYIEQFFVTATENSDRIHILSIATLHGSFHFVYRTSETYGC